MSAKTFSAFLAVALVVLGIVGQAQAFSPASVPGLQSWLDPSVTANLTINGSNQVTNFVDSKNGTSWYNTCTSGSNPVGYWAPTYSATAINGYPGLLYAGSGTASCSTIINNASILNLASTNTVLDFFGVVELTKTGGSAFWTTDTGNQTAPWTCLEANPYSNSTGCLTFTANSGSSWPGTAAGQIATDGTPQILEMIYNGSSATMTMYKNGNLIGTSTVPTSFNVGTYIATGGQGLYSTGTNVGGRTIYSPLNGAEGDMLWYNAVLSNTDRGDVGAYLQTKYGITGSYVGVPEPGTLALLAAGLAGLLCYAWRKRR